MVAEHDSKAPTDRPGGLGTVRPLLLQQKLRGLDGACAVCPKFP